MSYDEKFGIYFDGSGRALFEVVSQNYPEEELR
jgi:hypothetical protein